VWPNNDADELRWQERQREEEKLDVGAIAYYQEEEEAARKQ
jgi:hypothetical protein